MIDNKKIIILFFVIILIVNCSRRNENILLQDENILLIKAYSSGDYIGCLEILQDGADGRIDYLQPNRPLLFDICQKYLDVNKSSREIEELFAYYLKNRKKAFEDSIRGVHPKQTVGSYLARFASVDLLKQIVQEKININSPDETDLNSAIFELAGIRKGRPIHSDFFNNLAIDDGEKKVRMELLLDAGADVTLIHYQREANIFHIFGWYPIEEDYTELLDKMIENGADLFHETWYGSCIFSITQDDPSVQNGEAYLEYVISRGLGVTKKDIGRFNAKWSMDMRRDISLTPETEIQQLERIKKILEENVKRDEESVHEIP